MSQQIKLIFLLMFMCQFSYSQDAPYYPRSTEADQDLGAINQNFRDLSTRGKDSVGDTDVPGDRCIDTPTFCVDATNDRVGMGTASPRSAALDVRNAIYLGTTGTDHGVINSDDSIIANIDANNDQTDREFTVAKDKSGVSGGTNLFIVNENGLITMHKFPTVILKNSAVQTLVNGAEENLEFDSEEIDSDGMHSLVSNTDRIVFQRAGIYSVSCAAGVEANSTGIRQMLIKKNGTDNIAIDENSAPSGTRATVLHAHRLYATFAANDYVTCHVYQDSGGNRNDNRTVDLFPVFSAIKASD